ncbi:hypothetical protein GCM10010420_36290 [Streptomyces glaucosporus]|uniref:Uncharacterized protein n=1 Tax=Streptomyces glaucosporus TaxID=284044 RepID=A0ABP5VLG3_9ACTN
MNQNWPGGYQHRKCGLVAAAIHFRPITGSGNSLVTTAKTAPARVRPSTSDGPSEQLSPHSGGAAAPASGAAGR